MHERAPDFHEYLSLDRDGLFAKLAECVTSLTTCLFELGYHEAEETRGRARAYQTTEGSANARYQEAAIHVAEDAAVIQELKAQRDVLLEEKQFILGLIDARYSRSDAHRRSEPSR